MMARGVNSHENRGSQQHHRPAIMGRQGVAIVGSSGASGRLRTVCIDIAVRLL